MADSTNAYSVVIADLKAQRDEIDRVIAKLEAMASGKPVAVTGHTPAPERTEQGSTPETPVLDDRDNPFLGMSIVDAAKAVLARNRKAMSPADLVEALETGGLLLSGTNKANTVGSVLNRRQRQVGDIVSPKRGKWGLKEWYPGRNFAKKAPDEGEENRENRVSAPNEPGRPSAPTPIFPLRSND